MVVPINSANGPVNICLMYSELYFTSYCCWYISSGTSSQQRNLERKGNINKPKVFNLKADTKFNTAHKKAYLTRDRLIIELNNSVASISERLWRSKSFLDTVMAFLLHLVFDHVTQQNHFLMDHKSHETTLGKCLLGEKKVRSTTTGFPLLIFKTYLPLLKMYFVF